MCDICLPIPVNTSSLEVPAEAFVKVTIEGALVWANLLPSSPRSSFWINLYRLYFQLIVIYLLCLWLVSDLAMAEAFWTAAQSHDKN